MLVRVAVLASVCALSACGQVAEDRASSSDAGEDSGIDVSRDTGDDSPSYGPDDFRSFRWMWYGTSANDRFFMDRDCGVDASTLGGGVTASGAGVIATDDCLAFKVAATSKKVTSVLAAKSGCDSGFSDDYGGMTLALMDGGLVEGSIEGCMADEAISAIETEMRRLARLYAFTDAGGAD